MTSKYELTTQWFEQIRGVWDDFIPKIKPQRILEVGSFEGASACYLIDAVSAQNPLEIHCVDTWGGGIEHQSGKAYAVSMSDVERRFKKNTAAAIAAATHPVDLHIHKERSDVGLAKLISSGLEGYFDFIYIDGSHQAPDVLADAVLAFRLLKVNGVLGFDDYLWSEFSEVSLTDPLRCPKVAVDAFVNIYARKIKVMPGGRHQLYVRKYAD